MDMAFGDYHARAPPEAIASFAGNVDFASEIAAMRGRIGRLFAVMYPRDNLAYLRACAAVHGHLASLIAVSVRDHDRLQADRKQRLNSESSESEGGARYCLLDELLQVTTDQEQIRWEIVSLLAAGRDTTASFLNHLLHVLVREPRVWAKLLEEIATLNGRAPGFDELQQLKYLKAVLNESESQPLRYRQSAS